jgi:hypothetical protein
MADPQYKLPESTLNRLLAYLSKRPWEEADPLIRDLQQNAKPASKRKSE